LPAHGGERHVMVPGARFMAEKDPSSLYRASPRQARHGESNIWCLKEKCGWV